MKLGEYNDILYLKHNYLEVNKTPKYYILYSQNKQSAFKLIK